MQNKNKILLALIAILSIGLFFPSPSYAEEAVETDKTTSSKNATTAETPEREIEEPLTYSGEDGTYTPDMPDGWWRDVYYVKNNAFVSGFQTIDDTTYYFDPATNILQKGQLKIDGYLYYFDSETGAMAKSEFINLDGTKTVYYDQDGHMLYGIQNIEDKTYLLDNVTGAVQYGQRKIGKFWYYFNSKTGAMAKAELVSLTKAENRDGAKTVYYDQSGHMLYGIQNINGQSYFLDNVTGAVQYGQRKIGKFWYFFNPKTGAMAKTQFVNLTKAENRDGAKTVYYDQSGHMLYGLRNIKNVYYYFNTYDGALQRNAASTENNRVYKTNKNGIVYSTRVKNVPYYAQYDRGWGNARIGGYTIRSSGCSVMVGTSIINFVAYRNDHPQYIANRFHDDFHNYNSNGIFGTTSDVWRKVANSYDMRFESGMSYARIQDHLRQGHLVKTSVKAGTFISRGTHALLLMGLDSQNNTQVYDPNDKSKNGWYPLETIWNEQSTHSDDTRDGGPFFALWR